MKFSRIGLALLVLLVFGIAIFTRILNQQEKKENIKEILSRGNHIVNFIALHSIRDFEGERRNFFLRTLVEYTSSQGLVYCVINDQAGQQIVSLLPHNLRSKIPNDIQTKSLAATGLPHQIFKVGGSGDTIYQFAKPVFENGEKTGAVRIGLRLPGISTFSMERISLLAMLSFFIISAVIITYYGFAQVLKPIEELKGNIIDTCNCSGAVFDNTSQGSEIARFIENLKRSLVQFKDKFEKIKNDNEDLISKSSVLMFEKKQVINILDSMDFGIVVTDIQNNITHMNNYMLNLLSRKLEDVLDQSLGDVLANEKIESFVLQHQTIKPGGSTGHIETTFSDIASEEVFRVSLCYLGDDGRAPIGKIIFVKNIAGEKSGEKTQQDFIAHISHELLTPLTTIKSYNEMLMDGEIENREMQKEFYNTISEETSRLSRLIRNLLNISKIEMGSLTINKGLVKTNWLFEDCVSAIEPSALSKNITIEKILPDEFPSIIGDKELLKVAINNILSNAVKYTPEGGTITFSINDRNNIVIYEVTDTGYGIADKDISNIFDKFYRSADPNIIERPGTGLGLSITSEIIKLHGGKIEVQSEPGKGTCFTIILPKNEQAVSCLIF
ncbi:MAG: cell wall metabolism sensor histidine kinase WalK [Deltaproteobacteria bacterium]|nr:cell wall metabolism sensor histidine kinase WalK [Deltaproteobacteria bacterium]